VACEPKASPVSSFVWSADKRDTERRRCNRGAEDRLPDRLGRADVEREVHPQWQGLRCQGGRGPPAREKAPCESHCETAEDFIKLCGAKSSQSGKPYQIRFKDGKVVSSGQFLRQELKEFEKR
jgi:hypothetical protein